MNETKLKMMSQSCPDSKSISNQINNFLLNQLYLLYQRSTTESKGQNWFLIQNLCLKYQNF